MVPFPINEVCTHRHHRIRYRRQRSRQAGTPWYPLHASRQQHLKPRMLRSEMAAPRVVFGRLLHKLNDNLCHSDAVPECVPKCWDVQAVAKQTVAAGCRACLYDWKCACVDSCAVRAGLSFSSGSCGVRCFMCACVCVCVYAQQSWLV